MDFFRQTIIAVFAALTNNVFIADLAPMNSGFTLGEVYP